MSRAERGGGFFKEVMFYKSALKIALTVTQIVLQRGSGSSESAPSAAQPYRFSFYSSLDELFSKGQLQCYVI